MKTIAENIALSPEERLEIVKEAKGGSWYDNWKPYCMMCGTWHRMEQHDYGFRCNCCGNMIGWDLTRLVESPLNHVKNS